MRAANEQRRPAPGRAFFWACAFSVGVTVAIGVVIGTVVGTALGAAGGTPGGVELVLAVAVVSALTTSLLAISRTASPVVRAQTAATGASGHIEASTAYWCAVTAPRRPQRPRAPGRR
ncbi:MAG: hypothetical protein L0H96_07985 [Humibacillus sp.]|nr:hypothetical protein [Humibacillus sp.]MDN5776833.1 hypothetical protein [Humibacillus sp.]